ncbi:hypothetical protein COV19_06425 [Candidatus Woesearchaeota archaeon CG10_big_fil_rev_8_21_14_0_10_44_13]|nr:MAG: hypothetical protein COV19_06425 [Candidatus Woesearchaeota archaeon CG10_big_fil_rev_8_21_14_0_10_44_13]
MSNIKGKPTPLTLSNNVLEALAAVLKHDFVHIREISRMTGVSPTTAGNALKELEENNILSKKTLGKNCFYSLNKNQKSRKLVAIVEDYNFLKACSDKAFSIFSEGILKDVKDIKNFIDFMTVSDDGSGPSILLVTSLDNDTVKSRLSKSSSDRIKKIMILTRENFRNNLEEDMIKNLLKDHITIFGTERLIDTIY